MERTKAAYTEGVISIIINSALFILKIWAGIVSGSLALTADAWHTLSDSVSSVVVIIGAKLSRQKPDKKHPFGHGRWEQISAIFIGFFLAIIAYDFIKEAIVSFRDKQSADFGTIAIVVTCISIATKEVLAQYAFYIGRITGNLAVKADGWHHRSDALSSVFVLIGIFFSNRFWWIDSVLGAVISIMLFYAAFQIIKESINKLLGEKPDNKLIKEIEKIIIKIYNKDLKPHHFHIHNYTTHQELTFHIKLDSKLDIDTGHKIATDIENEILKQLNITSTVHVEPHNFFHESD